MEASTDENGATRVNSSTGKAIELSELSKEHERCAEADGTGACTTDGTGACTADGTGACTADGAGACTADGTGACTTDGTGACTADGTGACTTDGTGACTADGAGACTTDGAGACGADGSAVLCTTAPPAGQAAAPPDHDELVAKLNIKKSRFILLLNDDIRDFLNNILHPTLRKTVVYVNKNNDPEPANTSTGVKQQIVPRSATGTGTSTSKGAADEEEDVVDMDMLFKLVADHNALQACATDHVSPFKLLATAAVVTRIEAKVDASNLSAMDQIRLRTGEKRYQRTVAGIRSVAAATKLAIGHVEDSLGNENIGFAMGMNALLGLFLTFGIGYWGAAVGGVSSQQTKLIAGLVCSFIMLIVEVLLLILYDYKFTALFEKKRKLAPLHFTTELKRAPHKDVSVPGVPVNSEECTGGHTDTDDNKNVLEEGVELIDAAYFGNDETIVSSSSTTGNKEVHKLRRRVKN